MTAPVSQTATLGEIGTFQAGVAFPPRLQGRASGEFPFAKVGDISRAARIGAVLDTAAHYVDRSDLDELSVNPLPAGSIVFAKIGEAIRQNFRAITSRPFLIDNNAMGLIPDPSRVDGRYLFYFLKTVDFYRLAEKTTVPSIRKSTLMEVPIPLFPLSEQRRIAVILDRAEALRAKRREALVRLDTLTQSIFLAFFGDPVAEGWRMTTVGEMAAPTDGAIRTGPFGSQLLHGEFVADGVAVLGIDNVVSNEFQWGERRFITVEKYRELTRYTVRPGDVLITIMGTCGRCAVVPADIPIAINTKHLCCITLDPAKCTPTFLHAHFLRHPLARQYLDRTAKGAIMAGLNMGLIKAMPIPCPPVALQRTFSNEIAAVESLKAAHRASLTKVDALFASLQHRAFRGEL